METSIEKSRAVHGHALALGIWRQEGRGSRIALVTWETISRSIKRMKNYPPENNPGFK